MSSVGPTQGIISWFSSVYNKQSSWDSQEKEKLSSSHPAPLSDKQIEKLREDAINSLMNERGLSREVAESQVDTLS